MGPDDLQVLELQGISVDDVALVPIRHLRGLRALHIQSTAITDAGLTSLESLGSLEQLTIDDPNIGDEGLAHLAGLASLEKLTLENGQYTGSGLRHLKSLTRLQSLYIDVAVTNSSPGTGGRPGAPTTLYPTQPRAFGLGVASLKGLPKLWSLSIGNAAISSEELGVFEQLPALVHLEIAINRPDDAALARLCGLRKDVWLSLSLFDPHPDSFVRMGQLIMLRRLVIFGGAIDDAAAAHLEKLAFLISLTLMDSSVSKNEEVRLQQCLPQCSVGVMRSPTPRGLPTPTPSDQPVS